MKKETLKEIGKYHLDISKILAGLIVFSPIAKGEHIEVGSVFAVLYVAIIGFVYINKGAKDE